MRKWAWLFFLFLFPLSLLGKERKTYFLGTLQIDPKDGWLQVFFPNPVMYGHPKVVFPLYYHSNRTRETLLGTGWASVVDTHLEFSEPNHILVVRPSGQLEVFDREGKGEYVSRFGALRLLKKEAKGWKLTSPEGEEAFDLNGRLVEFTRGNVRYKILWEKDRPISLTTDNGISFFFHYQQGRLVRISSTLGRETHFTYSQGRLVKIQSFLGKVHFFQYDHKGRLHRINGEAVRITYNDFDQVSAVEGKVVPHRYYTYLRSQRGKFLTEEADGAGNLTIYSYHPDETIVKKIDPLGRVTVYYFDQRQLLKKLIQPGFRVFRFRYNQKRQLTQVIDPDGKVTSFRYNSLGRLISLTRADGTTLTFHYTPSGRLSLLRLPKGLRYRFGYTKKGWLKFLQTPEGLVTKFYYNSLGKLVRKENNRGLLEEYTYNQEGRLLRIQRGELILTFSYQKTPEGGEEITVTNNLGMTIRSKWSITGKLEEYIDPRGRTIRYAYTPQGMVQTIAYPNGSFASFQYDSALRLVSLIDPAGRVFSFGYDGVGNLVVRRSPDGRETRVRFNEMDLPVQITFPNGRSVQNTYDKLGRLIRRTTSEGDNETFRYDALGRLVEMKNQDAHYQITYDELGRPTELWDKKLNVRLRYRYNAKGLRSAMIGPFGEVKYFYDATGRIQKVVGPHGETFTYSYDRLGRLKQKTFPNGVVTQYRYDALGRVVEIQTHCRGKTLLRRLYTYDKRGLRKTEEDEKGRLRRYVYDMRGQLIKVVETEKRKDVVGEKSLFVRTIRYRYDNSGNRIAYEDSGKKTTYAYDIAGRLVLRGKIRYLYDAQGNLKTKIFPTGRLNFYYNSLGRLRKVVKPNGEVIRFGYAPHGARVWKESSKKGRIRYLYDFEDVVAEFKNGKMIAFYLHGPGIDEPLGMFRFGKKRYYHTDVQGSVVALTGPSGEVRARYAYKAFGEVILEWGFREDNPYRFSGRWYDEETGLYYYRSRYYDPQDGRFTSEDPLLFGGGQNLYAYCGNDPVNYVDPWGAKPISLWGVFKGVSYYGAALAIGFGGGKEVWQMRKEFVRALFSRRTVHLAVLFGRGFGKGIWGGVKDFYITVRHPIRTAQAVYTAVKHWDDTKAILGEKLDQFLATAEKNPEEFAKMLGEISGGLVFSAVTAKGLDKVGKLSAVAKLKGVGKVAAVKGMRRLSRFARSRTLASKTVVRITPKVPLRGFRKIGKVYVKLRDKKLPGWILKKLEKIGRGYWEAPGKTGVLKIVSFGDRVEAAVEKYRTYERAGNVLNQQIQEVLEKLGENPSLDKVEAALEDIDTSFDNYRDFLFKPVHDVDLQLKKRLEQLDKMVKQGILKEGEAKKQLKDLLVSYYFHKREKALQEVYLKNRPPVGYAYIDEKGRLSSPSKNRISSYEHQIQLYHYLRRKFKNNPKVRKMLERRIQEISLQKERDLQNFLRNQWVDFHSQGFSDAPPLPTEGIVEKLRKTTHR